MQAALPFTSDLDSGRWSIASHLPGRLRIRSRDLIHSPPLRSHCRQVLANCHWLAHFRINAIAGSLCITYPRDRCDEVEALLEQALRLSDVDQAFAAFLVPRFDAERIRARLTHAAACLVLIGLEGSLALPAAVMAPLAVMLFWPMLRRVARELRQKELSLELVELSFSSLMVQQGFSAEALLDLAIDDAVTLAQSAVAADALQLDTDHLLARLGDGVSLRMLTPGGEAEPVLLRHVTAGQVIQLQRGDTTFVETCLLSGALIVVNRFLNGDWRPRQVTAGEAVEAGALILNGEAQARVEHGFERDPAYALLHAHTISRSMENDRHGETWVDRYQRLMPPLQLGMSGGFLAFGSVDAALATLQFNALGDWQEQKLASQLTAIADLRLHRLRTRRGAALESLGSLRHLLISRSCLEGMGGSLWRETLVSDHVDPGSLLALLAGVEAWICGHLGPELWFSPEQQVETPVAVGHVAWGPLQEGWRITGEDGRCWMVRQRPAANPAGDGSDEFGLEVWRDGMMLGWLVLCCQPDCRWLQICRQLRELGIQIHLIGAEGAGPLHDLATALDVDETHTHTAATPMERWQIVEQLQQRGERVGYLGSVFQDLSAMEQADVSIGLDLDESNRHVASLCDLALSRDILWLPRLIRISRGLRQTSRQNFALVGSSQLAASLATAAGWIAPLEMVLLSDIPRLLAEFNNLLTLKASGRPGQAGSMPTNKQQPVKRQTSCPGDGEEIGQATTHRSIPENQRTDDLKY
jgi:hypothetical protein